MAALVFHINREVLHHGAEVALLMDLYAHRRHPAHRRPDMNTPTIQIAVDAADPHALARFWAAAVGYDVEDHHDIVAEMLERGFAGADDTVEIDGRLAWRDAAACRDPRGTGPRLLFQAVPEPKTVKDRIHLDLHFPRARPQGMPRSPG